MEDKNLFRLITFIAAIILFVLAVYLVERPEPVVKIVGAILLILSPFIIFAIHKAGLIIIDPALSNASAARGLIRLFVVCLVVIPLVTWYIFACYSYVSQENQPFPRYLTTEFQDKFFHHSMLILAAIIIVGPVAVGFVMKGFAAMPSKIVVDASKKRWKVCDDCGRIMDKLDQPQSFENKILCKNCFEKLKEQNDNST